MLSAGFSLVSFSVLARSLSKEDFGYWSLFLAIWGFFEMVRNGLIGRPLVKMASEGDDDHFLSLVASSFKVGNYLSILLSLLLGVVFGAIWLYGNEEFYLSAIFWFFVSTIVTIPLVFANWTNTAKIKFERVVLVNSLRRLLFMGGCVIVSIMELQLFWVFVMYTLSAALTGMLIIFLGWTSLMKSRSTEAKHVKQIVDFGKYSMGTMLGSSALTSSDSFIIMAFLGPEALALYNVPMRIIGLYDIPLRSLMQIAFPTLAKVKNGSDLSVFSKEFDKSNGFTFLILLPVSVLIFFFAEPLSVLIGGEGYAAAAPILQIFSLYLTITPLDRFGGIALDVLNKPNINFRKMMWMLVINIIGDLIAVSLGGDILYVAVASIFTFALGTVMSYYYLRHELPFRVLTFLVAGTDEVKRIVYRVFFMFKR